MGRKIDIKKIEDITKCQVTFSKRRSSLMKKANEIAVCCDVDVAFVAFSPSGRVSKFSNRKRIEDVLQEYVNLPADKRLNHLTNVQAKLEKVKQLGHIKGDTNKLQYLGKQIENLELQIKKSGLELQIFETGLRDYELSTEQDPSLHQLSWCEKNLNHSLRRIIARKNALAGNLPASNEQPSFQGFNQMELERQPAGIPFSSNSNRNNLLPIVENPATSHLLKQLDPWISPYSARVRESILQDLIDQSNYAANENLGQSNKASNFPNPTNIYNFPTPDPPIIFESENIAQAPPAHISSLVVDQTSFDFHDQNVFNACDNMISSLTSSDDAHMSSQSLCSILGPRFISITTVTAKANNGKKPISMDECGIGTSSQFTNSNLNQITNNMEGHEVVFEPSSMYHNDGFNIHGEDNSRVEWTQMPNTSDQTKGQCHVYPHMEVCQETLLDHNLPQEGTAGDSSQWTSRIQKTGLWEWEDLLLNENFNVQDL